MVAGASGTAAESTNRYRWGVERMSCVIYSPERIAALRLALNDPTWLPADACADGELPTMPLTELTYKNALNNLTMVVRMWANDPALDTYAGPGPDWVLTSSRTFDAVSDTGTGAFYVEPPPLDPFAPPVSAPGDVPYIGSLPVSSMVLYGGIAFLLYRLLVKRRS